MPEGTQRDVWTRILLAWITCIHLCSSAPSSESRLTFETDSSALLEGRRVLSRAKRGWVWNQMFVLEEFSGPDPILVGRVSHLLGYYACLSHRNINLRFVNALFFALDRFKGFEKEVCACVCVCVCFKEGWGWHEPRSWSFL